MEERIGLEEIEEEMELIFPRMFQLLELIKLHNPAEQIGEADRTGQISGQRAESIVAGLLEETVKQMEFQTLSGRYFALHDLALKRFPRSYTPQENISAYIEYSVIIGQETPNLVAALAEGCYGK